MNRSVSIVCLLVSACAASAQQETAVAPVAAPAWQPITVVQRVDWVAQSTVGPTSLVASEFAAGIDTWRDVPHEYGTHWDGFGQRFGLRLADRALTTGIEAGAGSLWGEDPRYVRAPEKSFRGRVANVLRQTVLAHNSSGGEIPAYARFIAVPSAAFLSNAWKPPSQSSIGDAADRIGFSFGNLVLANAYAEFWPDLKRRVFHHSTAAPYTDAAHR